MLCLARRRGGYSLHTALRMGFHVLCAVEEIQERNIMHRDMKSANVLVFGCEQGGKTAKVRADNHAYCAACRRRHTAVHVCGDECMLGMRYSYSHDASICLQCACVLFISQLTDFGCACDWTDEEAMQLCPGTHIYMTPEVFG